MFEVLVWLLLVSPSDYRGGLPHSVERFQTQAQCEHVLGNLPGLSRRPASFYARCVQANILVPKGGAQ